MTHCRCCDMPLFHPLSIQRAICSRCFMALDKRLLEDLPDMPPARRDLQRIDLERMWKLDGSHVKEGAIYR